MALKSIGRVPWSREDMIGKLEEFSHLYAQRPAGVGGCMQSPHLFLAWFVLGWMKPRVIVESGVLHGRGTWFFEQACPDAQFYCIEPNLRAVRYRPENATYFTQDFSTLDWSHLPKEETILFFDDHQNAFERVKQVRRWGLPRLIFEDNYPLSQGDCYSLKRVFMQDEDDARHLEHSLEIYYELPPVFKSKYTRWGDLWGEEQYPTSEPLLHSVEEAYQQIYLDEADTYTWMCYVEIKRDLLV